MKKEEYKNVRKSIGFTKTEFGRLLNYGGGKHPYPYKITHEKEIGKKIISNSDAVICNIINAGLRLSPKTTIRMVRLALENLEILKALKD